MKLPDKEAYAAAVARCLAEEKSLPAMAPEVWLEASKMKRLSPAHRLACVGMYLVRVKCAG